MEFFKGFLQRNPVRHIEVVRSWQDGTHVFVQAYQIINNGESEWITADFFDSDEEGKIIEHWDTITAPRPPNPSGRTQIDGETEIKDLDKTDVNKQLVKDFIQECLIERKIDRFAHYVSSEKYIQHNADVADGLEQILALYSAPDCKLSY